MFGEKRKHDELVGSTPSCTMDDGSDTVRGNTKPVTSSISCECMHRVEMSHSQKRVCRHDNYEPISTTGGTVPQPSDALWSRLNSAAPVNESSTHMEVDISLVDVTASSNGYKNQTLVSGMGHNLSPSVPKHCLRCASGEPGHIKHIVA